MIARNTSELMARYHELGPGDVFIGTVSLKYLKESVLIDLAGRGVCCFPDPLSQILSGSKAAQALILADRMAEHTRVISRRMDLIHALNDYKRYGIGPVVSKEDRMHCGHGIRRWESIETLYSFLALTVSSYPFVLQPFMEKFTDVRVIIAGSHAEAYVRYNPDNFRNNLSSGGIRTPYDLKDNLASFCRDVMERGKIPYAHLDIHITDSGNCILSEIALNGGLKGAMIDRNALDRIKHGELERLAEDVLRGNRPEV